MVVIKKNGQKIALSRKWEKIIFLGKKDKKKSEKGEIPTKSEPRRVLSNVLIF